MGYRKRNGYRSKTIKQRDIINGFRLVGDLYPNIKEEFDEDLDYIRPMTRGECPTSRPCPFVGCRHHLYLDVNEVGSLVINNPDIHLFDMKETCSLDVADCGDNTLEDIGALLYVTRERIRQIESRALQILLKRAPYAIGEFNDLGLDLLENMRSKRESQQPTTYGESCHHHHVVSSAVAVNPSNISCVWATRKRAEVRHIDPSTVEIPQNTKHYRAPKGWSAKTHTTSINTTPKPQDEEDVMGMNIPKVEVDWTIAKDLKRANSSDEEELSLNECIELVIELEELIPKAQKKLELLRMMLAKNETLLNIFQMVEMSASDDITKKEQNKTAKQENLPLKDPGLTCKQRLINWARSYPLRLARTSEIADEVGIPREVISAHLSHLKDDYFINRDKGVWSAVVGIADKE